MGARNSDGSGRQRQLEHKEVLAPTRLIHALSLAYLVAALVPRHANWMESLLGLAMATIGRHSLRVFCVGLFFAWIISRIMEAHPAEAGVLGVILVLPGIAALWTLAVFSERNRTRVPAVSKAQTAQLGLRFSRKAARPSRPSAPARCIQLSLASAVI